VSTGDREVHRDIVAVDYLSPIGQVL
jgi:hypothetical protein